MKYKKLIFLLAIFLLPLFSVNAASITLGASSKSVTVGSTVTIYINGNDVTGKVGISSSNTSVLSGGDSSLWIEPSGSVTFKANKVGSSTINVSTISLSDGDGNDVNLGTKSITINVVDKAPQKTYSSNNSLKSLSVEGYELSPEFDSGTTEYSVEVSEGTESIKIIAEAQDSEASINGIGDVTVSEGLNVVDIVVTAENGYQKTYTLNVTVLDEPITVQINDKDFNIVKQASALPTVSSFYEAKTIEYSYKVEDEDKTIEIPAYYSEITGYTLVGLKDENGNIGLYIYDQNTKTFDKYDELNFNNSIVIFLKDAENIPSGYKKVKLTIGENEIVAYQKNQSSDYYLIYGMNVDSGSTGWYHYDSKDNTIQRYDTEEIDELGIINRRYNKTIVVLGGIVVMLTLFTIISTIKNRKQSLN